jgi:PAS domain S-box-containing protein
MPSAPEKPDTLSRALREIQELRRSEAWLAAQKEAFQAAMDGAPLEQSLGILVRTAVDQVKDSMQCGFWIADDSRTGLHHVVGLPEDYARRIDGFPIGLDSFACGLAVATGQPVITPNVDDEPRWKPMRWLAEEYGYRALWSFPVHTDGGNSVGTFTVYFPEPREATARDVEWAEAMAHAGAIIISRHTQAQKREWVSLRLHESEERLRLAVEASHLAIWDWDIRTGHVAWNEEHYGMLGYRVGEIEPSYAAWANCVHPEDRVAAEQILTKAMRAHEKYQNEFRIVLPDGTVRWCVAHGTFFYDEAGEPVRMLGLMEDVTGERQQAGKQRVLIAELQHRTRNLLAVVQSISEQTMRTAGSFEDFKTRFNRRLGALSRVQGILSRADDEPITIGALVGMELEALGAAGRGEVELAGPHVLLRKSTAQIFSLAIHELATNALKYGALAKKGARLAVRWRIEGTEQDGRVLLEWIEDGIAAVLPTDSGRRSYGRALIEEALPYSLSARTTYELDEDSLRCVISLPLATTSGLAVAG